MYLIDTYSKSRNRVLRTTERTSIAQLSCCGRSIELVGEWVEERVSGNTNNNKTTEMYLPSEAHEYEQAERGIVDITLSHKYTDSCGTNTFKFQAPTENCTVDWISVDFFNLVDVLIAFRDRVEGDCHDMLLLCHCAATGNTRKRFRYKSYDLF